MPAKKIIFCIPTYNEADSIGGVVKAIDRGLGRFFARHDCLILNVDSDSRDGTKEAFLRTRTKNKKIYLNSLGLGKGRNMKLALEDARDFGADALGFIDGDIKNVEPVWVKRLIAPVLRGSDHVLPVYARGKYDGTITNNLVAPILRGILGVGIRQPIGGETALSKKAIKALLFRRWPRSFYLYGVDIFLTTESIFHGLKIGQVFLGVKSHKPSGPKLNKMFLEVADSLFRQLANHEDYWRREKAAETEVADLGGGMSFHLPHARVDRAEMTRRTLAQMRSQKKNIIRLFKKRSEELEDVFADAENENFTLGAELWARLVVSFILLERCFRKENLIALRPLFFLRVLSFFQELNGENAAWAEREVLRQAKIFSSVFEEKISGQR